MSGQPWLKFYTADWQSDHGLRSCSIAARGLWIELLCIMHKAEPVGHLLVNGRAPNTSLLARLCATPERQVKTFLDELRGHGVFDDVDGVIVSRRMVRDAEKAIRDKANGRKGGNPKVKAGDNGGVNPKDNGGDKAQKPEARSQKDTGEADASPVVGEAAGGAGDAPPDDPPDGLVDPADVHRAFDAWNVTAVRVGLAKAKDLTGKRRKLIAARLRDGGGLDGWRSALGAIERSPLCRGEKTDWKASLDWMLSPTMFQKLVEGTYDPSDKAPRNGKSKSFDERLGEAFADLRRKGNRIDDIDAAFDALRPRPFDDDTAGPIIEHEWE